MAETQRWNDIAGRWWRGLQTTDTQPGNRAALARLRRCSTPAQAATVPEALDLARQLGITFGRHHRFEGVLLTAMVLAHVREDDRSASLARQLGGAGPDQRAAMSPLRFARLLNADSTDEKLIAFRRAVALLRGVAHVPSLAAALLDWSEQTRIAWAFEYHGAPPPRTDTVILPAQPAAGDAP